MHEIREYAVYHCADVQILLTYRGDHLLLECSTFSVEDLTCYAHHSSR